MQPLHQFRILHLKNIGIRQILVSAAERDCAPTAGAPQRPPRAAAGRGMQRPPRRLRRRSASTRAPRPDTGSRTRYRRTRGVCRLRAIGYTARLEGDKLIIVTVN